MSKYAKVLADAIHRSKLSNSDVVSEIGGSISVGNVSHWKHGRRPLPAAYAPALARLLNVPPESISESYESLAKAQASVGQASAVLPGHVLLDRLHDFGKPDERTRIMLPDFLVLPRVCSSDLAYVRWTLQPTSAMTPEIQRGALLLVDSSLTSIDHVTDGGVYAYSLWGRPDVRRVLILRDGLALARRGGSADKTFIGKDEMDAIVVHGLVLGWINSTNYSDAI